MKLSMAYSYQKQFEPLSGSLLWDALLFMGLCVVLGVFTAWVVGSESRAAKAKKNCGVNEPPGEAENLTPSDGKPN